ncbi:endo-beta-1 4-glucanase D [Apiospora arundinis]
MRLGAYALGAFAGQATAHAIFQQLWVDGKDQISGADMRCNVGGARGVSGKCTVAPGSTVTVEMHQQPGDRNCRNEAIGGAHYGPVNVYLSKVDDASRADGSAAWYKIFANAWAPAANSGGYSAGDNDQWGVKDLNACCGRMDVAIPPDTPAGDYLLRAEVIALHTAGQAGGAQFYISRGRQWRGKAVPAGVRFPGAIKANDPGVMINIHAKVTSYVNPGPAVVAGGETRTPGKGCTGCEKTCKA